VTSAPTNLAVAHRRIEPADSLDYFPTPPWAVRALFTHILGTRGFQDMSVEEPASGEGHMAYALADYFGTVRASDIFDYGVGADVRDYLDRSAWADIPLPDWTVMNPPFAEKSLAFMRRALGRSRRGVAVFVRNTQLGGINRYRDVFRPSRPAIVAPFVERVPLHRGRWVPYGSTMTDYCWIVFRRAAGWNAPRTDTDWIPPGCRDRLLYQRDLDDLVWFDRPAEDEAADSGQGDRSREA